VEPYYGPDAIDQVNDRLAEIESKHDRILLTFSQLRLNSEEAREFSQHGFMRRLETLRRTIRNVFNLIPLDQVEVPDRSILQDAQINIQAFFANVYGSIDNLAWIWVHERGLAATIRRNRVGLRAHNSEVRSTFSPDFQAYLQTLDDWIEYVIEYRDALAHRIPVYIPPGGVPEASIPAYNELSRQMTDALYVREDGFLYERLAAKQETLLVWQPLISHSVKETTNPYRFHIQMLADYVTVEEIANKVLVELTAFRRYPTSEEDCR
jgi:hypothetical protein